jgi:hypothetical protein
MFLTQIAKEKLSTLDYTNTNKRIDKNRQEIYWKEILDTADIKIIERYLRKKKLEKIGENDSENRIH